MTVFLLLLAGLLALSMLAATIGIGMLLLAAAHAEAHNGGPDDTMAVADAVAEQPKRRDVTAEQRRNWRASDAWIGYAEQDTDWHALEYMATGKRTEVSTDGR